MGNVRQLRIILIPQPLFDMAFSQQTRTHAPTRNERQAQYRILVRLQIFDALVEPGGGHRLQPRLHRLRLFGQGYQPSKWKGVDIPRPWRRRREGGIEPRPPVGPILGARLFIRDTGGQISQTLPYRCTAFRRRRITGRNRGRPQIIAQRHRSGQHCFDCRQPVALDDVVRVGTLRKGRDRQRAAGACQRQRAFRRTHRCFLPGFIAVHQ